MEFGTAAESARERVVVSVATKPDLVVFRVTSLSDPSHPVRWAGRNPLLGVSSTQASPVGLNGWRTKDAAQSDLRIYLGFMASILGTGGDRYEAVVMGPKVRT